MLHKFKILIVIDALHMVTEINLRPEWSVLLGQNCLHLLQLNYLISTSIDSSNTK